VEKKLEKKEICQCKNCGNEAEMIFTCTLPESAADPEIPTKESLSDVNKKKKKQAKGSATCTHCGNEAEMWIDY
jgi:hypothetical protein